MVLSAGEWAGSEPRVGKPEWATALSLLAVGLPPLAVLSFMARWPAGRDTALA